MGISPIVVHSGYRSVEANRAVGGVATSAHLHGLACDFVCPAFGTPANVALAILKSEIEYDQLILEYGWVHVGLAQEGLLSRREALTKRSAMDRRMSPVSRLDRFPPTYPIDISQTLLQGDTLLKKYAAYLPTVVLLLTAIANAATPAIAAFWMSHASVAAIVAPLAVVVAHWLPSPVAGANSNGAAEP